MNGEQQIGKDPAVGVLWPNLRYCQDILVEELRKFVKDLNKDSLGREYKALKVETTYSCQLADVGISNTGTLGFLAPELA
jgi:hypothetical protein